MPDPTHPLMLAIHPLVSRIGAAIVEPADLRADDVPLAWEGEIIAGIRLAANVSAPPETPTADADARNGARPEPEPAAGLDGIIADIESQLGTPLAGLDRAGKQRAVRMLEESGAFSYRKSVEAAAAALGISRFTVYNYLNRDRD